MEHEEPRELDDAIKTALNNEPRAQELCNMREVLERRLDGLRCLLADGDEKGRRKVEQEIAALTKQVGALHEEELVAGFVEDSVKFAWRAKPRGVVSGEW